MSAAFEARLTRSQRRRGGVFNTPWSVAVDLARTIDEPGLVCDPSCGTGTLLLAAAERLVELGLTRAEAAALLVGVDVDPAAVAVARSSLRAWSGDDHARFVVGDALALALTEVDHVIANPPFVDRLHGRFLALAAGLARRSVAIVLPQSVLATNDGRTARDAVVAAGFGVASVTTLPAVFDASVAACVVVLRPGAPAPRGSTWSSLLVEDAPHVDLAGTPIGAVADVVAGFRQHYYGLRGHVHEGGDGLPLVTSGAIEPGRWGGVPVRFDGVRYAEPRVTLAGVDEPVRSWFEALLRPKVLLATQTKVLEAAADPRGEVVPSVPVISVVPHDAARLWHVLAVLLAPPVSAWAITHWGGTALSSSAIKLGAPSVRDIPMPHGGTAWDHAAARLRDGGDVRDAGAAMCDAYGVGDEVHAWWLARLR